MKTRKKHLTYLNNQEIVKGNDVARIDPRYTTQECSKCHSIVPKTLAERVHESPYCGLKLDRDTNAARNIEQRALEKENSINPRAGAVRSYACGD